MSLAAIVQAMADAGCTSQQIAAAVRAYEESGPVRSKHAEAQARYRAKKAAFEDNAVITRDHGDHAGDQKEMSPHTPLKENTPSKENPPKGGQKKGSRLPEGWQPTPDDRAYGTKLGFSTSEIDGMAEAMRLWAGSAAGQNAVKRDWSLAFKGWMRREVDRRPTRQGKYQSPVFTVRGNWISEGSEAGIAWRTRYPGVWKSKREERNGEWGAYMPSEFPPKVEAA